MAAIVEVQGLTVAFGELKVLANVDLTVAQGEFVILIGPSGCGKSTLLRVISGVIPGMIPASVEGKVRVAGQHPLNLSAGVLDVVLQEKGLLPWKTARGNVQLGLELLDRRSIEEPELLLESVGLESCRNLFPHELSGGMKQRVALASSLATEPQLLLMDEPLGALDALTREEMWVILERLHRENSEMAIILVTHHIEEAAVLGDRIIVMVGCPNKGYPSVIAERVRVNLSRPRIEAKGVVTSQCLEVANAVRETLHNKGGWKDG